MPPIVGTTANFDMTVDEIIQYALDDIGGEHTSFYEARKARTALNLIFLDLQNRGMAPLASMEQVEVPLVSGSSESYPLPTDCFEILDAVIHTSVSGQTPTDLPLERVSYSDWLEIPTKTTPMNRPSVFYIDKQRDRSYFSVWGVPTDNTHSFKAWCLKRVKDVSRSYQLVDLPVRYLPAIIAGLKYYMAPSRKIPLQDQMTMKAEYLELLDRALDEDRERVDFGVYPSYRPILGS